MAQKRMFDKRVVDTDKFIDLPNSTKALYFMAGMSADDKGFFQPRKLQKICGFTDDDFKILIAKNYFIVFESGVMVVTDWNKNNWLDSRRISETEYIDELNLLKLVNEKYEFKECGLANAKQMLSENSIVENSIVENSIEYNIYSRVEVDTIRQIVDFLNQTCNTKYKYSNKKIVSLINARLKDGFTIEDFKIVISKKAKDWLGTDYEKFLRPETLFGTKFESYLNQKERELTTKDMAKVIDWEEFL